MQERTHRPLYFRVLKHTHIFCKNKYFNLKQKENDAKQLQNVLFHVALGVYIGELQKRADLKNDEICKSVHIGHSTFNDLLYRKYILLHSSQITPASSSLKASRQHSTTFT